jgi:hypothetical protein
MDGWAATHVYPAHGRAGKCISKVQAFSLTLPGAGTAVTRGNEPLAMNLRTFGANQCAPSAITGWHDRYQGREPPLAMDLHPVGVRPMAAGLAIRRWHGHRLFRLYLPRAVRAPSRDPRFRKRPTVVQRSVFATDH